MNGSCPLTFTWLYVACILQRSVFMRYSRFQELKGLLRFWMLGAAFRGYIRQGRRRIFSSTQRTDGLMAKSDAIRPLPFDRHFPLPLTAWSLLFFLSIASSLFSSG